MYKVRRTKQKDRCRGGADECLICMGKGRRKTKGEEGGRSLANFYG